MKRSLAINALLLAGLAVGLGACKKSMSSASPESAGAYGGAPADYGGEESDYDEGYGGDSVAMEDMEMEPAEVSMSEDSFRSRRADRRTAKRMETTGVTASPTTTAAPEPPPPPKTPAGGASKDGNGQPSAEKAVESPDDDMQVRHIVYTAQMTISVFNLAKALEKAEALPDTYGGYVQTISASTIVLRIPSKNLRPIMSDVGEYGVIEHRALQAQDVTAEFTDVQSRIKALTETQTQLLALLSKARNVEEALHVRQALDSVNSELEVLKGRLRQLGNQITYSTLTLNLVERGPNTAPPSSNDPFPWVNDLGVEATEWK